MSTNGTQGSPVSQPPSPNLQPHAHPPRQQSASSSQSSSIDSATPGSPSNSSDDSSSSIGHGSSGRADLTTSIISTLDLDDQHLSSPMTVPTNGEDVPSDSISIPSTDDEPTTPVGPAGSSSVPRRRVPLVREDTSTRWAMESFEDTEEDDEGTSSQQAYRDGNEAGSSSYQSRPDQHREPEATSSHHHHHHHHHTTFHSPSTESPHQPKTTQNYGSGAPETIPTVSATGMPRIWNRRTEDPSNVERYSSGGPPPAELQPEGSVATVDEDEETSAMGGPTSIATGSLTLAALTPSSTLSWTRRISILSASVFINLGLPFINGAMLGFGEIWARTLIAPLVIAFVGRKWPHLSSSGQQQQTNGRRDPQANRDRETIQREVGDGRGIGTSGVGIRATSAAAGQRSWSS